MNVINLSNARPVGKASLAEAGLQDAALAARLAAYRGRVAANYRTVRPTEIASVPAGIASIKLDGALWFLVLGAGEPFLANTRGAVLAGELPIFAQAPRNVAGLTLIAGELHARVAERRSRVGDLGAALGGGADAEVDALAFAAFDLLPEPDAAPKPYAERIEALSALLPASHHLFVAASFAYAGAEELTALYDTHVASGHAEGLVLRAGDGMAYKLKPQHTIDATVIGYTERADQPGTIRSLLLALVLEDGQYQVWGACGNVGSDAERAVLGERLVPMVVPSRFRYASDSGGLYTFVRPEVVVEVTVTDLQGEKSDGSPAQSMTLTYGDNGWSPMARAANASPIHPAVVRVRDDKVAKWPDVRNTQITNWLVATAQDATASLAPSTVLRRSVWGKDTKGKRAVRKLLVWKTNKETDPRFAPYVVHWTDYSAGRGTPLDREVRLALDEPTAMQIADEMVADNIKKGWEKV